MIRNISPYQSKAWFMGLPMTVWNKNCTGQYILVLGYRLVLVRVKDDGKFLATKFEATTSHWVWYGGIIRSCFMV